MRLAKWVLFAPLALAGLTVSATEACSSTKEPLHICHAGRIGVCVCTDGSAGTYVCKDDETDYGPCGNCQGTPVEDSGGNIDIDSGQVDAANTGIPDTCTGKLTILAGPGDIPTTPDAGADTPTAKSVYTAVYNGGGAFKVQLTTAQGLWSHATLVPVGGALVAAFRGRNDFLFSNKFAATWSSPALLNSTNPKSATRPTFFATPDGARVLYNESFKVGLYEVGNTTANGWDPATTSAYPSGVTTPEAGTSPYRYAGAIGLAAGSLLGILVNETDRGLYTYSKATTSWSTATRIGSVTLTSKYDPSIIALEGTSDALAVYVDSNFKLYSVARTASSKVWAAPVLVDGAAIPSESPSLVALPGSKALVTWIGSNKSVVYSIYDATKAPAWSTPKEMVPNGTFKGTPQLSPSRCGGADVTAVYANSAGAVAIVRFGTIDGFRSPIPVGGIQGAQWVGVGELP